jgi:hypothetical protein
MTRGSYGNNISPIVQELFICDVFLAAADSPAAIFYFLGLSNLGFPRRTFFYSCPAPYFLFLVFIFFFQPGSVFSCRPYFYARPLYIFLAGRIFMARRSIFFFQAVMFSLGRSIFSSRPYFYARPLYIFLTGRKQGRSEREEPLGGCAPAGGHPC